MHCQPRGRWSLGVLTNNTSSTQGGRMGIYFALKQSLLSTAHHQREVPLH